MNSYHVIHATPHFRHISYHCNYRMGIELRVVFCPRNFHDILIRYEYKFIQLVVMNQGGNYCIGKVQWQIQSYVKKRNACNDRESTDVDGFFCLSITTDITENIAKHCVVINSVTVMIILTLTSLWLSYHLECILDNYI